MPLAAGLLLCMTTCVVQPPLPVAEVTPVPPLPAGAPADGPMSVSPPPAAPPPLAGQPVPGPMPEVPAPVVTPEAPPTTMPAPVPGEAATIRARFGAPDFIRREMNNELWRYDSERCAVFFFLQRDGNILKLRYTETLPRGMDTAADPACVAALDQRMTPASAPASGSPVGQP